MLSSSLALHYIRSALCSAALAADLTPHTGVTKGLMAFSVRCQGLGDALQQDTVMLSDLSPTSFTIISGQTEAWVQLRPKTVPNPELQRYLKCQGRERSTTPGQLLCPGAPENRGLTTI